MSFKHNCLVNINNTGEDIEKINSRPYYEIVDSFNKSSNLNDKTKVIIVGTLTPYSGRVSGYFYSADNCNQIQYKLLDDVFNKKGISTRLNSLKDKLINATSSSKNDVIRDIKRALDNLKIAFLDVIEKAESSIYNPSDDAIENFSLDYNAFSCSNINYEKVVLIPNSRNAEYALKKILQHNQINPSFIKIIFASQSKRAKGGYEQRVKDLERALFGD